MPQWLDALHVNRLVGLVPAHLQLPSTGKSHDVFHVSMLKSYYRGGRVQPPTSAQILKGEEEYEVEQI